MLYDDYIAYTTKYQKAYGDKTVVLMEVGSFFEIYGVVNETVKEGAPMSDICDVLNIQMSRKNKSIPECSRSNPLMAGFPSFGIKKFMDILVAHNYTVVLIEQTTPPPNPHREVTQIISPSTYLEGALSSDNNYLMCVYFTCGYDRTRRHRFIIAACSLIDITTGETIVYEIPENYYAGQDTISFDEMNRCILHYNPKEVVVIGNDIDAPLVSSINEWCKRIRVGCVHNHMALCIDMYVTLAYQTAILQKAYPHTGMLKPIEYIDLETRLYGLLSFVYLINFAYEHNDTIISRISKPHIVNMDERLLLANSCMEHLNIISNDTTKKGPYSSLLSLLNTCDTPMGKRLFKYNLLSPITDTKEISNRYDTIDMLMKNDTYDTLRRDLGSIYDLERLFRRMLLGVLQPCEMAMIDSSLQAVCRLHTKLINGAFDIKRLGWSNEAFVELKEWMEYYGKRMDVAAMSTCTLQQITGNLFLKGVHADIDSMTNTMREIQAAFQGVCDSLNETAKEDIFKLDCNEKGEYSIFITKKRYETFVASHPKAGKTFDLEAKPVSSSNKSQFRATFSGMHVKQQQLSDLHADIRARVTEAFQKELAYFVQKYCPLFSKIIQFISNLDVSVTNAKNAIKFKYCRPVLAGEEGKEESCVKATGLRHPLIEVIQTDVPYVANDIELGTGATHGMLLYGINAVGKSSLMKSLGMSVIMAQAGMYVAAQRFEYRPYSHVFTRIPGGDNLFRGQSTFAAEMSELRNILKRATTRSLVIGDELCSGTESVSAISIVAAGILSLAERGTTFIFATHLHEVGQLDVIRALDNVAVYHMHVRFDEATHMLVYDRKLKQGGGETLYGLEVCKSLDLPLEFLHAANKIRHDYLGMSASFVAPKQSRYSPQVFVDVCSICNKRAEEVHHIQEQHLADEKGFINQSHKDSPHNLMTVCQNCHDDIHAKKLSVKGYVATDKGVKLEVERQCHDENAQKHTINARVRALKADGTSIKNTISKIAFEFNVTISAYQVSKILKDRP